MKFSSIFCLAAMFFFAVMCYAPIAVSDCKTEQFWMLWGVCAIAFYICATAFVNAMDFEGSGKYTWISYSEEEDLEIDLYERLN